MRNDGSFRFCDECDSQVQVRRAHRRAMRAMKNRVLEALRDKMKTTSKFHEVMQIVKDAFEEAK